jgi:hypothetical protein
MQEARRWLTIVSLAAWAGVLLYFGILIANLGRLGILANDVYWLTVIAVLGLAISYWIGFRETRLPVAIAAGAEGVLLVVGTCLLIATWVPQT